MKHPILFCLLLVFCLIVLPARADKVRAWEDTITIPTYPWTPEDPNPRFNEYEKSIIYPYAMQDSLSPTKIDRTYRTLCLENEYLQAICIPELGGRIHSVLDKTTGQQMFHLNHVIKPGLIAMRGGWISGGIEWNSGPHGHTVSIISPVDAAIVEHEDGSASLEIANTDKIFRTRWNVLFTLRPGKAFLEEKISIYNPTDTPHPYYFWNNTAFPCDEGTRYMYPMTLGTDHFGTTFTEWPINDGRDMTWLKNYPNMTSTFSYQCVFDFFGAYHVGMDRGIVQFADHSTVPGKKAWTWGQSDFGLVSQQSLTDEDGPYIEVQSGPLATQSDYEFLPPQRQVAWEEWWYPVHGLGYGFEYATKDVAVQPYRLGKSLELRICATGDFPGASLTLSNSNGMLAQKTVDLTPKAPVIFNYMDAPERVRVAIKSADGAVLADYETPLAIPKVAKPELPAARPEQDMTTEEVYLHALRLHKDTDKAAAREDYEKTLARDPNHAEALRGLAVLDMEAGLNERALDRLSKAVSKRADDSLAWALLGAAQLRMGQFDQAIENGYRAARLADAAAYGYDVAGRANMHKRLYTQAALDFQKALTAAPRDARARDHYLLALIASGDAQKAAATAAEYVRENPLPIFPRLVPALDDEARLQYEVNMASVNTGEDEFELLDTACMCADAAMPEIAYRILAATLEQGQGPLTQYHLAWLANVTGNGKADEWLDKAEKQIPDCVFPSFPESIEPLKFAIEKQPKNGRVHLYLGNLYAGLGRIDEAVASWTTAAELDPKLSVAHRNLAMHAWKKDKDLARAEQCFAKAIEARPEQETLYRDRAQVLVELKRPGDAIEVLKNRPVSEKPRTDATILLAKIYVDEKRYTDALDVLEKSTFNNWEGQMDSWNLFNKSHVEIGKAAFDKQDYAAALEHFAVALTYPQNLRVGRPESPNEAEARYWQGRALMALNRQPEALDAWKAGAADGMKDDDSREKCQQALELLGKSQ